MEDVCYKCGLEPVCSKPYEKGKPMECCDCEETKNCREMMGVNK